MGQIPAADRWPTQLQVAFGFLDDLGFQVVDGGTYRLGEWILFGNGDVGIHVDCDGDCRSMEVKLIRLDDGRLPAQWWDRRIPGVVLRLREVAELLAPQALSGESDLPPLDRQANRPPSLQFWASVLQTVAPEWLRGDQAWFDNLDSRLRGGDGRPK
jgi:hypothetical protein